jgi:hypothetical protein
MKIVTSFRKFLVCTKDSEKTFKKLLKYFNKLKLLTIAIGLSLIGEMVIAQNSFNETVDDVYKNRGHLPQKDITQNVVKFFPIGESANQAEITLVSAEFKIYHSKTKKGNLITGEKKIKKLLSFDEIRILIYEKDGLISDVSAKIFLHTL